MRRIGWLVLVAACGGGTAAAPEPEQPAPEPARAGAKPASAGPQIAGTYSVYAGGGWARGEATIETNGPVFQLVWTYSADKSVTGVGLRRDDRLLVGFDGNGGPVSVGAYEIDGNRFAGKWASSEGGDRVGEEVGTLGPDGLAGGVHAVTGTDLEGERYAAQIHVREYGDGYRMWMMQGDERTRDGIALRSGNLIVWAWGEGDGFGAGDYRIAADGDALAGQWSRRGEYRVYWEVLSRRAGDGDAFAAPESGPNEEEMATFGEYQRELAALGHALREANQRVRNDCGVSAKTVSDFIDGGGDKLRGMLRRARAVKDRYRRKKWNEVPAPDPDAKRGLFSFEATGIRCITSRRYDEALIELERAGLDDDQLAWIAVEVASTCQGVTPDVEHHVARARMRRSRAVVIVLDAQTAACGE